MKKVNTRGGARPGAGNKEGSVRVEEKRKQVAFKALPSIVLPFKEKYGREWVRRMEELMQQDCKNK